MSATPVFIVDAFADRAFAGNPAAVCLFEVCKLLEARRQPPPLACLLAGERRAERRDQVAPRR